MNLKNKVLALGLTGSVLIMGCASPDMQQHPSAVTSGAAGAGLGAIAGAMAGNNIRGLNTGEGAIAGAVLGALIGTAMGNQQDMFNARIGAVQEQASTSIVNVKNSNGSYTPVLIRKVGNQFVGPRGECYNAMPTEEQLKGPYGF